jgi:hypothetical protein
MFRINLVRLGGQEAIQAELSNQGTILTCKGDRYQTYSVTRVADETWRIAAKKDGKGTLQLYSIRLEQISRTSKNIAAAVKELQSQKFPSRQVAPPSGLQYAFLA